MVTELSPSGILFHKVTQEDGWHLTAAFRALRSARAADREASRPVLWACSSLTRACRAPVCASAEARAASKDAALLDTLHKEKRMSGNAPFPG